MGRKKWVQSLVLQVCMILMASCSLTGKQIAFHLQPDGEQRGDEINLLRIRYLPASPSPSGEGPVIKSCPYQRSVNPDAGDHYYAPAESWESGYQLKAIASSPGLFRSPSDAPLDRRQFFIPAEFRQFLFHVEAWHVDGLATHLRQGEFEAAFNNMSEPERELLYANSVFLDIDDRASLSVDLPLLPTDYDWRGASGYQWVDFDRDWFRNDMAGGDDCIDGDGSSWPSSESGRVAVRGCRFHPFAPREGCSQIDYYSCDCQLNTPRPQPSLTPGNTPTASHTPTITPTRQTATPSATPIPSSTPRPSRTPGPSPTYDFSPESEATLSPAAQCPVVSAPRPSPDFSFTSFDGSQLDEIIDFLDSGGAVDDLAGYFEELGLERLIWVEYLTHNGVPEIIFQYPLVDVIGCVEGHYDLMLHYVPDGHSIPSVGLTVQDLNGNSVPEMIVESRTMGARNYTLTVQVYEWDGSALINRVAQDISHPLKEVGWIYWQPGSAMMFNGDLFLEDVDLNGTVDLELRGGLEGGLMANMSAPQLAQRQIWRWNGYEYSLTDFNFAEPTIKFHAAWLGDTYSLAGDYDRAIAFYQQAIFDTDLQAWNAAWNEYGALGGGLDPQPTRPPQDFEQGQRINAYARYRQLLVHHILGNSEGIDIQYQSLQEIHPEGAAGRAYAELAEAFRQAYLEGDGSIAAGCRAARNFADQNPDEILRPLGPSIYGPIWPVYQPQDICPFGD